jgi:hypothetical protein
MSGFRKFLAFCTALVFVFTAIFALIAFNFDRRGFAPQTYQRVFVNQGFYDRLPAVLAQVMTGPTVREGELPLVMRGMSPQAWEGFFRTVLPHEAMIAMGDEALNSIFAYLNMESDTAKMSLQPLKRSMTGPAGVTAVYTLLNAQPDCTLDQVAQMTINLITAQDIQFCKPPPTLEPILTPVIEAQMEVTAFLMPDEVTFASAASLPSGQDPRMRLIDIRTVMRLTPILPLGFLLLLTLLAVNSLRSWLDWWGYPFLATGLLAVLISLTGAPVIGAFLRELIVQRAPAYLPLILSDYAGDLASTMTQAIMQPVLIEGIILTFLALIMILISRSMKPKPAQRYTHPSEDRTIKA